MRGIVPRTKSLLQVVIWLGRISEESDEAMSHIDILLQENIVARFINRLACGDMAASQTSGCFRVLWHHLTSALSQPRLADIKTLSPGWFYSPFRAVGRFPTETRSHEHV